ncbi:hypothetical protein, partial [Staphylococcus epidermidis]|uniref:hypothetical protein n=1 Tax=Staphylococcus epidermidis TaxID=1282 RepID=UPI001C92ED46
PISPTSSQTIFTTTRQKFITLHKYLKLSPLLKPPTLPKQITDQPPLTVNPNLAKPPTHIKSFPPQKLHHTYKTLPFQLFLGIFIRYPGYYLLR